MKITSPKIPNRAHRYPNSKSERSYQETFFAQLVILLSFEDERQYRTIESLHPYTMYEVEIENSKRAFTGHPRIFFVHG
jgi:transcriptional regulator of met regulon